MKNNKYFIIITVFISLFLSFFIELFVFNHKVINYNRKYNAEIIATKDIKKIKNGYKTTSEESYIKIKIENQYVHKLQFNYDFEKDINWNIEYIDGDKNIQNIDLISSNLINKAIKKLDINSSNIKIKFHNKNIIIKNIEINNKIQWNILRIFVLTILLTLLMILIKYKIYFITNLSRTFFIISIICGSLFIFVSPKCVYNSWDDQIHLKNSYAFTKSDSIGHSKSFSIVLLQNKITNSSFQTTEEIIELYDQLNKIDHNTSMKIQINNYSPKYNRIVYIPFYIGMRLGKLLNLDFIICLIFGKLLNLLVYSLIIFFAIKYNKTTEKFIFVIGLLISNIFLATNFSYDSTITAAILLSIASFISMLESKKINKKDILVFTLSIIWASLPKAIYCPLLLLILFLPNEKFASKKNAISVKLWILIITLLLLSTFVLPMIIGGVGGDIRGGNTNASEQLHYIIHKPFSYIKLLIKFYISNGFNLFLGPNTLCGVAYTQIYINIFQNFIYMVSLIFCLYVIFSSNLNTKIISKKIKGLFSILYIVISLLISTAMYLSFTEVYSNSIQGVQARYFLPILLLLFLILTPVSNNNKQNKKNNEFLIIIISYMLLAILISLFMYYGRGV